MGYFDLKRQLEYVCDTLLEMTIQRLHVHGGGIIIAFGIFNNDAALDGGNGVRGKSWCSSRTDNQ